MGRRRAAGSLSEHLANCGRLQGHAVAAHGLDGAGGAQPGPGTAARLHGEVCMNIQNNSSLMEQLAASYALGTLRGGARRRFEALARDNATLRAAALIWQGRLASVAELQPQEAPSPAVWK